MDNDHRFEQHFVFLYHVLPWSPNKWQSIELHGIHMEIKASKPRRFQQNTSKQQEYFVTYPRRPVEPPALGIVWKSQQFLYRMFNHMRTKLCDQKLALTGGGADHSSNILAGRIFGWLLLIYSFHFWSALQPRCRNWFPQLYHFYFSIIRGIQYSAEKVEHVFVLWP